MRLEVQRRLFGVERLELPRRRGVQKRCVNFVKFGIGEKRPLLLSLENTLMSIWLVEALASRIRSNLIIALCADVKIQAIVPERRTSMIKGKFVATIEIDIAIDENTPNLLPFEKMKEAVHNDMEAAVKDMLCEEFGDIATVKVTKTFADLYKTEDKHEAD